MNCQCGGQTTHGGHEVKTVEGLNNWGIENIKPPVVIVSEKCKSCGRYGYKIFKNDECIRSYGL